MKRNYMALNTYLDSLGIDAKRIPEKSVTPEGYDYVREFPDGRPIYQGGFQLTYEHFAWPSAEVYENVVKLIGGGTMADLVADKPASDEQPKEEKPEPPKKTTTKKKAQ